MSGDQSILKLQGACASVNSPTTRMSTPLERIQSGIASHTRPSGNPDENESSETDAVRHDVIAPSTPCRRSSTTVDDASRPERRDRVARRRFGFPRASWQVRL
jgi:hypothetical protein